MPGSTLAGLSPNDPNKYLGPNVALTLVVTRNRQPTGADYRMPETGKLYPYNTFWLISKDPVNGIQGDMWYLSKIVANVAYWVQLTASSALSLSIQVQAATAPGVNPVLATAGGLYTINAAAVANHSVPIETRTRALNTFNVEAQYATTAASTDGTKSGLAHFNSAQFTVDANGFVSTLGSGAGITVVTTQTFTSNGTYTPTSGMVYAQIEVVGGGGGGGGASLTSGGGQIATGGGGGGGEYAIGVFDYVAIGASQAVTIGALGAGGVAGNNAGSNGGNSSVGALISANGGSGGGGGPPTIGNIDGGDGGTGGAGGSLRFPGGPGGNGFSVSAGSILNGGAGGISRFSMGTRPINSSSAGDNGTGYGGGGGGAANGLAASAKAGGNGTAGVVYITEYIVV